MEDQRLSPSVHDQAFEPGHEMLKMMLRFYSFEFHMPFRTVPELRNPFHSRTTAGERFKIRKLPQQVE